MPHSFRPAWSKDGKRLAFIRLRETAASRFASSLFLLKPGEAAVALEGTTGVSEFIWSNSGDFLLFVDDDRPLGGSTLNQVNIDTGEVLQLTPDGVRVASPQLSLDDSEIMFLQGEIDDEYPTTIFRMNLNTSNRRAIFEHALGIRRIAWSPVTAHRDIAMVRRDPFLPIPDRVTSRLYYISETGEDLFLASSEESLEGFLKWSPDGRQVLFQCDGFDRVCISQHRRDASRRLSDGTFELVPPIERDGDWSATGRLILYTVSNAADRHRDDNLGTGIFSFHVASDGRPRTTPVVESPPRAGRAVWRPDSRGFCARSSSIFFGSSAR